MHFDHSINNYKYVYKWILSKAKSFGCTMIQYFSFIEFVHTISGRTSSWTININSGFWLANLTRLMNVEGYF